MDTPICTVCQFRSCWYDTSKGSFSPYCAPTCVSLSTAHPSGKSNLTCSSMERAACLRRNEAKFDTLELCITKITNERVSLTHLSALDLAYTDVTDANVCLLIANLKGAACPLRNKANLDTLDLSHTNVTDAS